MSESCLLADLLLPTDLSDVIRKHASQELMRIEKSFNKVFKNNFSTVVELAKSDEKCYEDPYLSLLKAWYFLENRKALTSSLEHFYPSEPFWQLGNVDGLAKLILFAPDDFSKNSDLELESWSKGILNVVTDELNKHLNAGDMGKFENLKSALGRENKQSTHAEKLSLNIVCEILGEINEDGVDQTCIECLKQYEGHSKTPSFVFKDYANKTTWPIQNVNPKFRLPKKHLDRDNIIRFVRMRINPAAIAINPKNKSHDAHKTAIVVALEVILKRICESARTGRRKRLKKS